MGSRADDPSMHDAPTTIELYRQEHRIVATRSTRLGIGAVDVCEHDGLRIFAVRPPGRWRHDPVEVRSAAGVPSPSAV